MTNLQDRPLMKHPMAKWGLFMGLLFVLWFGGWYVFAGYANGKLAEALQLTAEKGLKIDCADRSMTGFPFRIGVKCNSIDIQRDIDGLVLKAGALRTTAQLYAPGKMVAELDGPFTSQSPAGGVEANWSMMRIFADAKFDGGFDLVSINFADLVAGLSSGNFSVKQGALHARPTPPTAQDTPAYRSLDLATNLSGVSLSSAGKELPPLSFNLQATLVDGYADLVKARTPLNAVLADGARIVVDQLLLSAGGKGALAISGPLELATDGLISGTLNIGVDNPKALADEIRLIDPVLANGIGALGSAVSGMGRPAKFGDKELRSIPVSIKNGVARLGFIQLGKIPPLVLR